GGCGGLVLALLALISLAALLPTGRLLPETSKGVLPQGKHQAPTPLHPTPCPYHSSNIASIQRHPQWDLQWWAVTGGARGANPPQGKREAPTTAPTLHTPKAKRDAHCWTETVGARGWAGGDEGAWRLPCWLLRLVRAKNPSAAWMEIGFYDGHDGFQAPSREKPFCHFSKNERGGGDWVVTNLQAGNAPFRRRCFHCNVIRIKVSNLQAGNAPFRHKTL